MQALDLDIYLQQYAGWTVTIRMTIGWEEDNNTYHYQNIMFCFKDELKMVKVKVAVTLQNTFSVKM